MTTAVHLGKRWLLAAGLALIVMFGIAAAPAFGQGYQLNGVSESLVEPGGTVTVHANGYLPGSSAQIVLESTPVLLTTTQANAAGVIDATVTIPLDTPPGSHTIKVIGTGKDGAPRTLSFGICVSFCDGEGGATTVSSSGSGALGVHGRRHRPDRRDRRRGRRRRCRTGAGGAEAPRDGGHPDLELLRVLSTRAARRLASR